MPNQYLLARDTINGAEGSVVVTRNGLNYVVAGMNNITANGEIQNVDMRVIGTNAIQDKPNGVKQTATGNIYYGDDIFREMLYNYITTGVMEEFDIQLTNSDPTVTVGRQTVVLYGCHLTGTIPLAILNDEEAMLRYDFNFAWTRTALLERFNAPATLGSR